MSRYPGRSSLLWLCLALYFQLEYVKSTAIDKVSTSLRHLSSNSSDSETDTAPPIFCLDVGIEIAFPSLDMKNAMESDEATLAGKSCLRSSPMNAVIAHLRATLRTYSLHAVDCVLEPLDAESSIIPLMGIVSMCSRSNMDIEEEITAWGHKAKRQIESLFENEKKFLIDETTGMVQNVMTSPAYEMPSSGSGLPQFFMGKVLIWSDGEEEEGQDLTQTRDKSFFTHIQMDVKNDGKIPLHLYRLTLVERNDRDSDKNETVGFVLPLVTPAVVQPGKSELVSFKAITSIAVDSSVKYMLYISHSSFRSHVFEGVLDGINFVAKERDFLSPDEDSRFSFNAASGRSILSSFPFAIWQIGFMTVAVMVGLAVTFYMRRKRINVYLIGRLIPNCFRRSAKLFSHRFGDKTLVKPTSCHVGSNRAAISKKGEDHIELESFNAKPVDSNDPDASKQPTAALRPKMPPITMKWNAPFPPLPLVDVSATTSDSLAPKALAVEKIVLDLDGTARLDSKQFETMWEEYVERFQVELSDRKRPTSANFLKFSNLHGISCLASGTVAGVEKYVVYAKQRNTSWFFLATVNITLESGNYSIIVKTSSTTAEVLVTEFAELVQKVIAMA